MTRTIDIPSKRAPDRLIEARARKHGNQWTCVVCSLPIPTPRLWVHVIMGGGVALHAQDETIYTPDPGDCGCHPIGPECAKMHPELKPFIHRGTKNGPDP